MGGVVEPAALLDQLCNEVTPERAEALRAAYALVSRVIHEGYQEGVYGRMISWSVPLSRYPKTYNKQPLMFVALAATKGHNALHMCLLYMDPKRDKAFRDTYAEAGQKLDMGRGCVRFTKLAGLNEQAITAAIQPVTVDDFLAAYEAARKGASASA